MLFYSLTADGSVDESSLHGSCPVGEGERKWIGQQWIRAEAKPERCEGNETYYKLVVRSQTSCQDYCAGRGHSCVGACDTSGGCECDESPSCWALAECKRQMYTKACGCSRAHCPAAHY